VTAPTAQLQAPQLFAALAPRKSVNLKFEVVAGAHKGAVLTLDRADYRIGSSPDADIVLSDAGVAPEHAVLSVDRDAVRVGAIGADVLVEQELLPLSRGRRVTLPVNLAIGAAQIHLSDPDRDKQGQRLVEKPLTAAALLACVAVAVVMISLGLPETLRATDPPDGSAAQQLITITTGQPGVTAAEAARELSARLDAAKIQTLHVSAEGGHLVVAGKLNKQQAADWTTIQQWFDQTYGGRIVLTTAINPPAGLRTMPALQLQAIWYGDHPYVITADGERYLQGAVLDNGWVIRDIGEDRLLLGKDGETVVLNYR
jgi:hypothetical protein